MHVSGQDHTEVCLSLPDMIWGLTMSKSSSITEETHDYQRDDHDDKASQQHIATRLNLQHKQEHMS